MSARTLHKSSCQPFPAEGHPKVLPLPAGFFQIRRNGIEFLSSTPISEWTEMTVEVETSTSGRKMRCTGVVVSCSGNRHTGYEVAMLFTDLSAHTRAQLHDMAIPVGR
jgi:hypothetical protein